MSRAYYNENNPEAAAWLRELIRAGLIADGVVDERSIVDVRGGELREYTQCHFFAGIGGWALALRLAGWPDDEPVWTGSCPCQPFSAAGKREVDQDERNLWPAFRARIAERGPAIIFGEQVASKDGRIWLAGVRTDLEAVGYDFGAADLCAAGLGAPHIRQRLYWLAVSNSFRCDGKSILPLGGAANSEIARSGPVDGMANAAGARLSGAGKGTSIDANREDSVSQRGDAWIESARRGGNGGMAAAANDRCAEHGEESRGGEIKGPEYSAERSRVGRLGDASSERFKGAKFENVPGTRRREKGRTIKQPCCSPYWAGFDLIPCRDGKARRVESGSFPLAHGIPGRVGLLRGYGNAIVPQLAAEFIRAAVEAIEELSVRNAV